MDNETAVLAKSDQLLDLLQSKMLQDHQQLESPQILDNSALQLTKSYNQQLHRISQLKQDLYKLLAEVDAVEQAFQPPACPTKRPFAPKWEAPPQSLANRLDHILKFS